MLERACQMMEQVVPAGTLGPDLFARLGVDMAERTASGLRVAASPQGSLAALTEIRNKAQVYVLVRQVSRLIGVPETFPLPLLELVARSYALGPFPALWAVEGLGHDYAVSWFDAGLEPRGLLTTVPRARALPPASLPMMHAGIGLGFAERLLEGAGAKTTAEALRLLVADVLRLCRTSSRPGYLGAALESLGLVTGLFHPALVAAVDDALRALGELEVLGFYWHGVGRSIYFRPANFLPCSTWHVFEIARRLAPDEAARRNAWAGLSWAVTLVNQRQPWILADLLVAPHGAELAEDDAFANGVASSIVMRYDTTPGAPFIEPFCAFRPRGSARELELWEALVARPCRLALSVYYPTLAAEDRLGSIFHYQRLPGLFGGAR
jgi:hypothetical protein